jgi:hypothetical protein
MLWAISKYSSFITQFNNHKFGTVLSFMMGFINFRAFTEEDVSVLASKLGQTTHMNRLK